MGPKRRGIRLVVSGRSLSALVLRLGVFIASVALVSQPHARAADDPRPAGGAGRRRFTTRAGIFEFLSISLPRTGPGSRNCTCCSRRTRGTTGAGSSKTFPDHPTFTFRSSHDGEYWFAVQTLTIDGKVSPTLDSTVEPNLKVVVDTFPPTLLLDPDKRRGSVASVRWEVKDENLDLKSLVVEYQVEGVGVWRRVPIKKPKLIGGQQWDAGTAEALKVRASVADKAGNVAEAMIDLPEGSASPPDLVTRDPGRRRAARR